MKERLNFQGLMPSTTNNKADFHSWHGLVERIDPNLFWQLEPSQVAEQPMRKVKILPGAKNSGLGRVADNYYHFLIDFAVRIFNECQLPDQPQNYSKAPSASWLDWLRGDRSSNHVCHIYVQRGEGFDIHGKHVPKSELSIFHPAGPMRPNFMHLFGEKLVALHHVSPREIDAMLIPAMSFRSRYVSAPRNVESYTMCTETTGTSAELGENECDEWSRQPAEYFSRFRQAVLSGALGSKHRESHTAIEKSIAAPGIVILERTNRTTSRVDRHISPRLHGELMAWAARARASKYLHFVEVDGRTMSVSAQARLFNSAKIVIANHGAGCSNIVFCKPGTHFFELPPIVFPCYSNLAKRTGLVYHATNESAVVPRLAAIWRRLRARR